MAPWQRVHSPLNNRVFQRPLGDLELGFYWDSVFSGTANTLQVALVETVVDRAESILKEQAAFNAWILLKQRFPLLGAQIKKDGEHISFVVEEDRIKSIRNKDEINFITLSSADEAHKFAQDLAYGDKLLSNDLLARIFIILRSDDEKSFHMLTLVAHSITDGVAHCTILRNFLDIMSTSEVGVLEPLESRLALSVCAEDLNPALKYNLSRQRWRRAIGHVISVRRQSKLSVNFLYCDPLAILKKVCFLGRSYVAQNFNKGHEFHSRTLADDFIRFLRARLDFHYEKLPQARFNVWQYVPNTGSNSLGSRAVQETNPWRD